jgi:preprotein translocase subunit SecD
MQSRYLRWLIPIVTLFAVAGYIAWPSSAQLRNPFDNLSLIRDISVRQGLDLQGGLQVLLEADVPAEQAVEAQALNDTKTIIENRVNGLGVTEPIVQLSGDRRLVVELPGLADTEQALALLKQTALLEFVDTGDQPFDPGIVIQTDLAAGSTTADSGGAATPAPTGQVYHTIMTGSALTSATVQTDPTTGEVVVGFELTEEGGQIFGQHTTANTGKFLTIVLDKTVISSPQIQSAITGGQGTITGNFTIESANNLALQLRYGSLPVPLKIAESRTVGPTLGQDSLRKSLIAGIVGLAVVAVFMILYYRLPGILAVLALLMYATITFALFKLIPVTLTLPGIAGFVLSVGVAVDANILIFERMKEELRAGHKLITAVEEGFRRAWASIRDSNISTLITCLILFWFGSQFGASVVKGFALTLALGVVVSLFTAVVVTRTLLHAMLDNIDFSERHSWFGI